VKQDTFEGLFLLLGMIGAFVGAVYFWGWIAAIFWGGVWLVGWFQFKSILRAFIYRLPPLVVNPPCRRLAATICAVPPCRLASSSALRPL
jgi:hypothetical protein